MLFLFPPRLGRCPEANLARFIDDVYNHKRLHSSLGYVPPSEFEDGFAARIDGPSVSERRGRTIRDHPLTNCRIVAWKGCWTACDSPSFCNVAWQTGFQGARAVPGFRGQTTGDPYVNDRLEELFAVALVVGRPPYGGSPAQPPDSITEARENAVNRL